jgi:hypothetical protein
VSGPKLDGHHFTEPCPTPGTANPRGLRVRKCLITAALALVLVLVTSRLALVLVITGLLKSRRGPTGPLVAELMVSERMAGANPLVLQVSRKLYPHHTEYKRPLCCL